jgi:FkbM family methyltransferase
MKIETIRLAGISRTKTRWITNPIRRLTWSFIKYYIAALLDGLSEKFREIEGQRREIEAKRQDILGIISALDKDHAAIAHRMASFEEEIARVRSLPDFMARSALLNGHRSFSQCGEDRIVAYIFERLGVPGVDIRYLDIGAAIATAHNNTYLFYLSGGSGVLLEADPKYEEEYQEIRPRDQFGQYAVVPEKLSDTGSIEFHLASDQGWSSVDLEHVKMAEKLGKGGIRETITVPTITIGALLEKYFKNETLHILSIDIEGIDNEVVRDIDFDVFRPRTIIMENPDELTTELLISKSYQAYASTYINQIFVAQEIYEELLKQM